MYDVYDEETLLVPRTKPTPSNKKTVMVNTTNAVFLILILDLVDVEFRLLDLSVVVPGTTSSYGFDFVSLMHLFLAIVEVVFVIFRSLWFHSLLYSMLTVIVCIFFACMFCCFEKVAIEMRSNQTMESKETKLRVLKDGK